MPVHFLQGNRHSLCCLHTVECRIGIVHRRTKDSHEAVTDEFVYHPVMVLNHRNHGGKIFIEVIDHSFGRSPLGTRGEAPYIREQNRDLLSFTGERQALGRLQDFLNYLVVYIPFEQISQLALLAPSSM